MNFIEIQTLEDSYELRTYAKYPLAVERGEGSYVITSAGERYLDFYGGHAVALTGHCHPRVVSAICEQAQKLLFYSNLVYSQIRGEAARAVTALAPEGLRSVFFCNSGAEANETAIKLARKFTGRTTIISMEGAFHGRTCGALSITQIKKYKTVPPFMPGVEAAEFGSIPSVLEAIERVKGDVAAIILEPVQSMAGVRIAPGEYYHMLRRICDERGIVLVFDEIQTGFGRCGANFFAQAVGAIPDLITAAKGIASGVPMGAVFVRDTIAVSVKHGEQGTTFGGGPLAAAAAKATAEILIEENLSERARSHGAYLVEKLHGSAIKNLKVVRGIGLLIGVEFTQPVKELVQTLLKKKVISGTSDDPNTMRLIPPLTVSEAECDQAVAALGESAETLWGPA